MSDNVHGLLGAYAVNAVTPDERAAFDAHLPGCEDCAVELTSLVETTAVLGEAQAVAPPGALRTRVMEQVARTAQVPPLAGDDAPIAGSATAPHARESSGPWPHGSTPRRGSSRLWPRLAVAASAVVVLALGGVVGGGLIAQRTAELALEKDVMMVASAPDAVSMDLGLGSAHLVKSDRMGSVVAMGDDCPAPADGTEYQLWLVMADGTKRAGPTFTPDSDGSFMTLMDDAGMDAVVAFAVTQEPRGGSEQPTTEAVAVVDL